MPATVPYLACDQVMAAFDRWHVPYKTSARWRSECRCHNISHDKGTLASQVRDFLRTAGFLLHITAGGLDGRTPEQYNESIILGDPKVALKAQFVTAPGAKITGKPAYVIINSCGRANHVMAMSRAAYDLFRNASWPLTGTVDRRGSAVDAKAYLYGWEMIAATKADPEQLAVTLLSIAALADALGWTGQETAGHGEVDSTRTPADPNENMGAVRRRVMALVAAGPGATPITEEEDMPLTQADAELVADTVNRNRMAGPRDLRQKTPDLTWQVVSMIESTQAYAVMTYREAVITRKLTEKAAQQPGPLTAEQVKDATAEALAELVAGEVNVDVTVGGGAS